MPLRMTAHPAWRRTSARPTSTPLPAAAPSAADQPAAAPSAALLTAALPPAAHRPAPAQPASSVLFDCRISRIGRTWRHPGRCHRCCSDSAGNRACAGCWRHPPPFRSLAGRTRCGPAWLRSPARRQHTRPSRSQRSRNRLSGNRPRQGHPRPGYPTCGGRWPVRIRRLPSSQASDQANSGPLPGPAGIEVPKRPLRAPVEITRAGQRPATPRTCRLPGRPFPRPPGSGRHSAWPAWPGRSGAPSHRPSPATSLRRRPPNHADPPLPAEAG